MGCSNLIMNFEISGCETFLQPNLIDEIEIEAVAPRDRKILKLLHKKTKIESIQFAGNGSFDEKGNHKPDILEGFKMKIVYFYPEILERHSYNRMKPIKFIWLL